MEIRTSQRSLPRRIPLFVGMLTLVSALALATLSLALVGGSSGSAVAAPLAAITGTATEFPTATRTAAATATTPATMTATAPATVTATPIPSSTPTTLPTVVIATSTVAPTATPPPPGVPEPSTWLLLTTGVGGLVGYARLRMRRK